MEESFSLFYKRKITVSENIKAELPHRFNSITKPSKSSYQHSQTISRAVGSGNRKHLNFIPQSHGIPDGHPTVVKFLASKAVGKQINPAEANMILKYYHINPNVENWENPVVSLKRSGVSIKHDQGRYWLVLNKR
jgi:hypothetical protein